jgi:nicotinamide mononucleotide transporter
MIDLLNSPAFAVFGSPASWAELIGAVLGLAMVVCNIRQIHWGWPLAFASSLLYCLVFYGSQLYGDAALQIFFAIMAVWGWVQWLRGTLPNGQALVVQTMHLAQILKLIALCLFLWGATGLFLAKFTTTDVPWWDAFPTAVSVVATLLLGRKYIENWPMWIVVNAVSIALFAYKGLWLTVGLYSVFLMMAAVGWQAWHTALHRTGSAGNTAYTP